VGKIITVQDLRNDPMVKTMISKGNEYLGAIGFTDHGQMHVSLVSNLSYDILNQLGAPEREAELAAIAGYLHDLGNVINRNGHSQTGALLAMTILKRLSMPAEEIAIVAAAIGNHDEGSGTSVNRVAAALILADKAHVHRSRVRNRDISTFDIHDRVNYAANESILKVDGEAKTITMELSIDTEICPVMEYFEIFLSRMIMCRRAASVLGCKFELLINGAKLI